jgi:hypothetical protein
LMSTRDYRTSGIRLGMAALPGSGDLLESLVRIAGFADRPVLAWIAADSLERRLSGSDADRPGMLDTANALAGGGPAEALLAVSVTREAGKQAGWPGEWREMMATLRSHVDPDVRLRALGTIVVWE